MHNVSEKSYSVSIVKTDMNFKTYASMQDSEQNTFDGINKIV